MKNAIVVYFSATETTRGLAENLATAIDSALFRIIPEKEYTQEDLDWTTKTSRSSVEMSDKTSRPKIATKLLNFEQYDVIFLGFPIWWYREPSIIDTFIESYDFNGKTIVPFATSGGSPMGESDRNIRKMAQGATVAIGKRFTTNETPQELKNWAKKWL